MVKTDKYYPFFYFFKISLDLFKTCAILYSVVNEGYEI